MTIPTRTMDSHMMIPARMRFAALLLLAIATPCAARAQDASSLSVERIYASQEFRSDFFGPARWL